MSAGLMPTWTDRDIAALDRILARAKATALSERNDAQRLFGAYGDKRPAFADRIDEADLTLAIIDRLRELTKTIKVE